MPDHRKTQGSRWGRHYISNKLANNKIITEVKASASWNSLFLAVVAVILLSGGIALIVIFGNEENEVQDLILIGAILLATSLLFVCMFAVSIIKTVIRYRNTNRQVRPCSEQELARTDNNKQVAPHEKRNMADSDSMAYSVGGNRNLSIRPEDIERQRRPSAASLYGMEGPQPGRKRVTSPPPQVALPVDSGVIEATLITVHSEEDAEKMEDDTQDNIEEDVSDVHNKEKSELASTSHIHSSYSSLTNNGDEIPTADYHSGDIDGHGEATGRLRVATDNTDGKFDDASQLLNSLFRNSSIKNNSDTDRANVKNHHGEQDSETQEKSDVMILINEHGVGSDDVDGDSAISIRSSDEGNVTTSVVLNNLQTDVPNDDGAISTYSKDIFGELGSRILHSSNADLSGIKGDNVGADSNKDTHSDDVGHTETKDALVGLYSDVQDNDDSTTAPSRGHLEELGEKILQTRETEKDHLTDDGSVKDDSVISKDRENVTTSSVLNILYADAEDENDLITADSKVHPS